MVTVAAHGSAALRPQQNSIVPSRARWKRPGGAVADAADAAILVALTFSVPAVILLVGAPLALAVKALLWVIRWL